MRDDFSAVVKDELARRVSFLCSNPACRQSTSGPQLAPSGTVNLGVAAHITAASSGGPRFDEALTPEQRASADNGIWLCQLCAKRVDNDAAGFPVAKLSEWKRDAETAAAASLERRVAPPSESEGVFLEAQRTMPDLINEMRADIAADETHLIREFVVLPNRNCVFMHGKPRFTYFGSDHPALQLQLDWLQEMRVIVDVTPKSTPIYRMTPEFAAWLSGPI